MIDIVGVYNTKIALAYSCFVLVTWYIFLFCTWYLLVPGCFDGQRKWRHGVNGSCNSTKPSTLTSARTVCVLLCWVVLLVYILYHLTSICTACATGDDMGWQQQKKIGKIPFSMENLFLWYDYMLCILYHLKSVCSKVFSQSCIFLLCCMIFWSGHLFERT